MKIIVHLYIYICMYTYQYFLPSTIESSLTCCQTLLLTSSRTSTGSGKCFTSCIPGVWFVCVLMYLTEMAPFSSSVIIIRERQYPSNFRDPLCFLFCFVFFLVYSSPCFDHHGSMCTVLNNNKQNQC